jgi:hypothetical protein
VKSDPDEPRIATDEGVARDEIERQPADESTGEETTKSGASAAMELLRVAPLFEIGYRYMNYRSSNTVGNTPALRQRGNLLIGARVEGFPVRQLRNFMVSVQGGSSIPQDLQTSQGAVQVVWWRIEAAASYRIALSSSWNLVALLGYARTRHRFYGQPPALAIVPDATYSTVRLGAGVGGTFDWLEVSALLENRPVLSGGVFANRFRTSSADGLAATLSAIAHLGGRYFARVDGNYARYAWSFGYDQADTYRAGGAIDLVMGFSLSAGASF